MSVDSSRRTETSEAAGSVEARLIAFIRDRLHIEVPDPEAELFESGLIDSLAFVELLLIVSQEFGVEVDIEDLDMDNFRSVRRIAAFIEARQAARPGSAP